VIQNEGERGVDIGERERERGGGGGWTWSV
jgi:hypothetical protein